MAQRMPLETGHADQKEIRNALNELMWACGLSGEIGTEQLFDALSEATQNLESQWDTVVGQSHVSGLCYDVNAWLAAELTSILNKEQEKNLGVKNRK